MSAELVQSVDHAKNPESLRGPALAHEILGTLWHPAYRHQSQDRGESAEEEINPPGLVSLVEHRDRKPLLPRHVDRRQGWTYTRTYKGTFSREISLSVSISLYLYTPTIPGAKTMAAEKARPDHIENFF